MDGEKRNAPQSSKALKWVKAGLSVFILFQLTIVLNAPNSDHYVGKLIHPVMDPYINFFELTNRWSFFAPDPGPPPVFVEFEILAANGEPVHKGRFPEDHNPYAFQDRQTRRIASTEFMMPGEDRVEKVMVPYLCGKYSDAESIKLWRVAYSIPTMDEVASGKRTIGDEVKMERRVVSHTFCERKS